MIRKILCLLLLNSGSCGLGAQGLLYELEQLSNPDILPQYRPVVVRKFSSYGTPGGNYSGRE